MTIYTPSATVMCSSGVLNAESASKLERELLVAIQNNCEGELVIDMSEVESLDSAGLAAFMSALNTVGHRGTQLRICSAPPSVRIVFELTQLDRVFTMVDRAPIAMAA